MWSYNNVHNPLTLRWSWLKGKPVPDPTESNVNSWWAQWRLKSPVFQLFDQLFVQAQIKGSSASLAFVKGIHRWPVVSPHKGPVTRTMFPLDDVIMSASLPSVGANPPVSGGFPSQKGPVTRKMLPFDYVNLADDDAGNLQPVFFKRLHLLHICISSFFLFNTSLTTI